MSIRTEISKKIRNTMLIGYFGFAVVGIGMILIEKSGYFPVFLIIGIILFIGAIIYQNFGIKFKKCNNNLGKINIHGGKIFSLSKDIKYCPYCGVDIDTD